MSDTPFLLPNETQHDVLHRLRRIEGQVRGVQRMVEQGQECRKIVNQVMAIKAALSSVNASLLECYVRGCLEDPECTAEEMREKTVEELIDMIRARDKREKTVEDLMTMVLKATR